MINLFDHHHPAPLSNVSRLWEPEMKGALEGKACWRNRGMRKCNGLEVQP